MGTAIPSPMLMRCSSELRGDTVIEADEGGVDTVADGVTMPSPMGMAIPSQTLMRCSAELRGDTVVNGNKALVGASW